MALAVLAYCLRAMRLVVRTCGELEDRSFTTYSIERVVVINGVPDGYFDQQENGILTIEFNRLEKKNAITAAMYQIMVDALKDAETDSAVRAILFLGSRRSSAPATILKIS